MQTCQLPFFHYKFQYEVEDAVLAGERPPIPMDCREDYKHLITACWHNNPKERPTFKEILNNLRYIQSTLRNQATKATEKVPKQVPDFDSGVSLLTN
jgi:hypothetical protein